MHYVETVPETIAEKKFSMDLKTRSKPRTFGLIGIFAVLLSVFGYMLIGYLKPSTTLQSAATSKTSTAVFTATPTVTIPPTVSSPSATPVSSSSAALNRAGIKIQINTSPSSATSEKTLQKDLIDQGFTNVTVSSQSSGTAKTLIIFNSTLSRDIRDTIFQLIQKQFPAISQQENAQLQNDAVIYLP